MHGNRKVPGREELLNVCAVHWKNSSKACLMIKTEKYIVWTENELMVMIAK